MRNYLFLLILTMGCASYTETLVSVQSDNSSRKMPVTLTENNIHIQMYNSSSKLGVYTVEFNLFNQGEEPIFFNPDNVYFITSNTIDNWLDNETLRNYSLLPEDVNDYRQEVERRNQNTALAAIGIAVAAVTVAVLASDDNNKSTTSKKRTTTKSSDATSSSSRKESTGRNVIRGPRVDRSSSTSTVTKSRKKVEIDNSWLDNNRSSSRKPIRRNESYTTWNYRPYYHYNRYQLNIFDFYPYRDTYSRPSRDRRDYDNILPYLPEEILMPQTVEPGEYISGKIFFYSSSNEYYKFVVPIGEEKHELIFKKK